MPPARAHTRLRGPHAGAQQKVKRLDRMQRLAWRKHHRPPACDGLIKDHGTLMRDDHIPDPPHHLLLAIGKDREVVRDRQSEVEMGPAYFTARAKLSLLVGEIAKRLFRRAESV